MTALGPGVRVKATKSEWYWNNDGSPTPGPTKGSVWTITGFCVCPYGRYLYLLEWPMPLQHFNPKFFVPLDGNEDLSDLITALKKGTEQGERERKEIVEIAKNIRTGAAEYVREAK